MLKFILLITLSINVYAELPLIKIAIIDTGLDINKARSVKLCDQGHYDFVDNVPKIGKDLHGHGTNIALTIEEQLKFINYCLIIYKYNYMDTTNSATKFPSIVNAIAQALNNGVDIINFSSAGIVYSSSERHMFNRASKLGVKVVVAAGNSGIDLTNKHCPIFPACYKGIKNLVVVGNLKDRNNLQKTSNYGTIVSQYEIGTTCFNNECMMGTSQAAAIYSGKLARTLFNIKLVSKPIKTKKQKR